MRFDTLVRHRFSPEAYAARAVPQALLEQVFEAGRWAQSSFNEQPWRFLLARRHARGAAERALRRRLEALLDPGNRFAARAPVLALVFAKRTLSRGSGGPGGPRGPNDLALHDVGAAGQLVALAAYDLGLGTRFMAGYDRRAARALAPRAFAPVVMFALGFRAEPRPPTRARRPLSELVFAGSWGRALFGAAPRSSSTARHHDRPGPSVPVNRAPRQRAHQGA